MERKTAVASSVMTKGAGLNARSGKAKDQGFYSAVVAMPVCRSFGECRREMMDVFKKRGTDLPARRSKKDKLLAFAQRLEDTLDKLKQEDHSALANLIEGDRECVTSHYSELGATFLSNANLCADAALPYVTDLDLEPLYDIDAESLDVDGIQAAINSGNAGKFRAAWATLVNENQALNDFLNDFVCEKFEAWSSVASQSFQASETFQEYNEKYEKCKAKICEIITIRSIVKTKQGSKEKKPTAIEDARKIVDELKGRVNPKLDFLRRHFSQ